MKSIAGIFLLLALLIDPTKIGKINSLKAEAKQAYLKGDFKTAVEKYTYLIDSMDVQEEEIKLNLANAYFQLNDTTHAVSYYQSITQSSKNQLRSKAEQQLGVITNRQRKFEEALHHFKEAIKSDPTNNDARYNYELLKKKLDEQKRQEQQKQNKDNKDKNEENKPDEPSDFAKKLKAQAEALAAQFRFKEALNLMNDGLSKDPSVEHYADFIKRLDDVVQIKK
jgi:tetratricopeptide (TPR) repeat protein